ncbi:MAG: segregation and condensation protein A [Granulosicoccaceae bacterium]|jgi:hypothetical protein
MSEQSNNEQPMELRVLRAMKSTLVNIIKDTTVEAGMRHPLSEETIEDIRQCLGLITARENTLAEERGESQSMRPRFVDEPQDKVVVSLDKPKSKKQDS